MHLLTVSIACKAVPKNMAEKNRLTSPCNFLPQSNEKAVLGAIFALWTCFSFLDTLRIFYRVWVLRKNTDHCLKSLGVSDQNDRKATQ